jgi:hypothetical protein
MITITVITKITIITTTITATAARITTHHVALW